MLGTGGPRTYRSTPAGPPGQQPASPLLVTPVAVIVKRIGPDGVKLLALAAPRCRGLLSACRDRPAARGMSSASLIGSTARCIVASYGCPLRNRRCRRPRVSAV